MSSHTNPGDEPRTAGGPGHGPIIMLAAAGGGVVGGLLGALIGALIFCLRQACG